QAENPPASGSSCSEGRAQPALPVRQRKKIQELSRRARGRRVTAPVESAPKPRLRVVAAALFDAQGRVLIAERPAGKHMAGWWEFPGGKVGPDESDAQALVRELREELGVDALPQVQ